ncbi:MAG: NADH-quinone oxidoreductase subunit H [Halanaerobiales bacterium]|nr:NADH-quinone oxidoreductase subunit H [Halanaerobiales bacterium]
MILNIFGFLLMAFSAMALGLLFIGIARKVVARVQKRIGPPFYQAYLDVFKLFTKNSITHGFIFDFGAIMAFGGMITTLFFVPVGPFVLYGMNGTLLLVIYLMAVAYLGMAMATVGSGNPLASVGISRALTQMLGYELPFIVVLLTLIYSSNTSSIIGIVQTQQSGFMNWNLINIPIGTAIAFVTLLGLMGKKPFDAPIAPSEIASGPVVEHGGKYLAFIMLQHAVSVVVKTALFVDLFLGGGNNIFIFIVKMLIVWLLVTLIGSIFPRFKVEEGVLFYWRWPLIAALLQAVIIIF